MGKYRTSEITAYFSSDISKVWDTVTDNSDYKWRSDISKIEIQDDGNTFVEYTHNGYATKFTITRKIEHVLYEFNMENKVIDGYWTGKFYPGDNKGTKIVFTENIHVKNPIVRVISYFFMDLKKMQNTYIADLKKKLGE